MKRSCLENKELTHNVRINGRISAAFKKCADAEDYAYARASTGKLSVEVSDQYGDIRLTLRPKAA